MFYLVQEAREPVAVRVEGQWLRRAVEGSCRLHYDESIDAIVKLSEVNLNGGTYS
jgi:hypothetical protein